MNQSSMKNQIKDILLISALLLLVISLIGNYFQPSMRKPVVETLFVTDTLVQVDTIIHTVTQHVTIDRPVPVYIDTTSNIRTYRDTIFHPFGTIKREELVLGEILKQDLHIDFKIPETLRTLTVTNSTTQTVRSPLLFMTGGFRYNTAAQTLMPTIGILWVTPGHQYTLGLEVDLDRTVSVRVGIRLGGIY